MDVTLSLLILNPVQPWHWIKSLFSVSAEWITNTLDTKFTISWTHWDKDRKHHDSQGWHKYDCREACQELFSAFVASGKKDRLYNTLHWTCLVFPSKIVFQKITNASKFMLISRIYSMKEDRIVLCVQISKQSQLSPHRCNLSKLYSINILLSFDFRRKVQNNYMRSNQSSKIYLLLLFSQRNTDWS